MANPGVRAFVLSLEMEDSRGPLPAPRWEVEFKCEGPKTHPALPRAQPEACCEH